MHNLACAVQLLHFCITLLSHKYKSAHMQQPRQAHLFYTTCTSCRMWTRSSRKSKSSTKHNTYHPRWEVFLVIS